MAGYYDAKKDYAAAIKAETDPAKKQQLISERQNKIDAMNAAGTNKGYTNDIYKNKNNHSSGNGGFDANKDYAKLLQTETDPAKRAQLEAERQNKIDWLNSTGQNPQGWTNDIYKTQNGQASQPASQPQQKTEAKGRYLSQEEQLQNLALESLQRRQAAGQEAAPTSGTGLETTAYAQTAAGTTAAPVQQAALAAYFNRFQSETDPTEVSGVYAGDGSMSLPDQALLKGYQAAYNQAKERGDTTAMTAAHEMAEKLRDNYRYYPLAGSNGYGLGENDKGFIRDMVVRTDELGNTYVDEYNRNSVTTTRYNADGTKAYTTGSGNIAGHNQRVAEEMARANARLAEQEKENNTFAVRLADAGDRTLRAAELMAKYGAEGNGQGLGLYTTPMAQAIANGETLATQLYGYFDPDFDYAAALQTEKDPTRRAQLMQERASKNAWLTATGKNPGYTNDIYGAEALQATLPTAAQPAQSTTPGGYIGMTRDEIYDNYNGIAETQAQAAQAGLALLQQQIAAQEQTANSEYDDLARQAYIAKRQSENALPQQLAALGISGGGSETANLKLQTNYQNNLNQSEQARKQALQELALQRLQAETQTNSDILGYQAEAQNNALNAWRNELANQNAYNQWAQEYALTQQQYQNSLSQYEYEKQQAELAQQIELAQLTGDYSRLKQMGYDTTYMEQLKDANLKQLALDALYTQAQTNKLNSSKTIDDDDDPPKEPDTMEIGNQQGPNWIYIAGLGRIAYNDSGNSELDRMVENGMVKEVEKNGKIYFVKG